MRTITNEGFINVWSGAVTSYSTFCFQMNTEKCKSTKCFICQDFESDLNVIGRFAGREGFVRHTTVGGPTSNLKEVVFSGHDKFMNIKFCKGNVQIGIHNL